MTATCAITRNIVYPLYELATGRRILSNFLGSVQSVLDDVNTTTLGTMTNLDFYDHVTLHLLGYSGGYHHQSKFATTDFFRGIV